MEMGSASESSRRQRFRTLWLCAALWTALVVATTGWLVQERLRGHREQTLENAEVRLAAVKGAMGLTFRQLAALPVHVAHQAPVIEFLASTPLAPAETRTQQARNEARERLLRDPATQAVQRLLKGVVSDFGLPLTMLLDLQGNIVATGVDKRYDTPPLARYVGDRAYFSDALANGSSAQFLLGRSTRVHGFFLTRRVERDGVPVGVAVVKQHVEDLNRLLADSEGNLSFLTDANGVILLSNGSADFLQRLPLGPEPAASAVQALYERIPEALPWATSQIAVGKRELAAVQVAGVRHIAVSSQLEEWPFKVWVFAPLLDEGGIVGTFFTGAGVVWLLGLLLLWAAWRRLQLLEVALQARRELLNLAQALPLTVFRYQQPPQGIGHFTFLGRGVEELFGVDRQALADDPTLPWRLAGEATQRPPTRALEFPVQRGDEAAWVLAHSTPLREADGSTVYNGYWLDITARRETETRFAAVFEHAPNGYVFFDRRRGVTRCNPATLSLFGASHPQQLLGQVPWYPPLSPELQPDGSQSRERVLELMRRHTRSGERVQSHEWRFCRLDGTTFDAEMSVIVLTWEGEPQFCAVIEDVTARKQAELATEQARAAAEAASQTKSSFLANMSHELRTPMNAIIGMTHLALEDDLSERQRNYIEKAHGSARNLLQILNDILDMSKIEAGHLELERIEFSLDSVVHEMADVLGLKADEKGLELLFSAKNDLPPRLVGDPTRLRQVLVNLGSNAIKFTDRGEVTFGMDVMSQSAEGVELHAWVRDTGVGMTDEELSRMFQPFMQADSSTTRRFGGTGLGLVISRQLVERMGGRLWAESRPGHGSTFHFTARFGRAAAGSAPRARTAADLRGLRALLADDNAAALDVLGYMLESMGLEVDRVTSGEEALACMQRNPRAYSWVLLDWKMPGMDGLEVARKVLETGASMHPCVLLVTAFARDDALRASQGLPLAAVLQKPVTPSGLHDCLLDVRRSEVVSPVVTRPANRPVKLTDTVRQRLAGARILLVEDHPLNQELACELLRRAGMHVVVAANGQDALKRLEQDGPFDGVLMDCQMPVMDGYTATRRLREDRRWQRLPVIAMTASALAEDRDRALESGMNAHITKPLNVELMLQTMAEWIVTKQHLGAADTRPGELWPAEGVTRAIDTTDGLARCMGKSVLYRRVLRGFRDAMLDFSAAMSAALADGRSDEALHRVHDLKGLSGTIGAHALHALAERLHAALAARQVDTSKTELALVNAELRAVLQEIDRLVETT